MGSFPLLRSQLLKGSPNDAMAKWLGHPSTQDEVPTGPLRQESDLSHPMICSGVPVRQIVCGAYTDTSSRILVMDGTLPAPQPPCRVLRRHAPRFALGSSRYRHRYQNARFLLCYRGYLPIHAIICAITNEPSKKQRIALKLNYRRAAVSARNACLRNRDERTSIMACPARRRTSWNAPLQTRSREN